MALAVEQRGEIAVIDARVCGRGNRGLGMIGDAEACGLQHRDVVRAIAGRERFLGRKAEALAQLDQRRELGVAPEYRLGDPAGELAVLDDQRVATVLAETDYPGDAAG